MAYAIMIGNGFYAGDDENVKSDINDKSIIKYDNIDECEKDINVIVECWNIDECDIKYVELA